MRCASRGVTCRLSHTNGLSEVTLRRTSLGFSFRARATADTSFLGDLTRRGLT